MKDESIIPRGLYCYIYINDKQINCPYWGRDKIPNRDKQENGYCAYLDKSDWDINEEKNDREIITGGKIIHYKNVSNHELGFMDSLLWDQVKECNVFCELTEDELENKDENNKK